MHILSSNVLNHFVHFDHFPMILMKTNFHFELIFNIFVYFIYSCFLF
jgi:hypothetical protein